MNLDRDKLVELFHLALFCEEEGHSQIDFLESRPFKKETLERFKVGYCPPHVDYYIFPRLKGRIICPAYDVHGKLLCFFGRKLEADAEAVLEYLMEQCNDGLEMFYKWDKAKWINESYTKTAHLYGLSHNKTNILEKGYAVVVEGNLDVVALYEHGITNAVATCGSQVFSPTHIALLSRYTRKVVIMSDADNAGDIAQANIKHLLRPYDINVYSAVMPKGQDPEDFVRHFGGIEARERIEDGIAEGEKEIVL